MTPRPQPTEAPLMIGDVVRRTGKAASAIRYYEELGLLTPAERQSGRRRYPPGVVHELSVIDTAQRAGLTLAEIRLLLHASPDNHRSTQRLREVAERKLPGLSDAIARAEVVRGWLEDASRCRCATLDDCPLFDEPARLPEPVPLAGQLISRARSRGGRWPASSRW